MSVAITLIGAVLFYTFLTLLGRTALLLWGSQSVSSAEQQAIAPVVGLSVLTLISTYLVVSGISLKQAALPVILSLSIASVYVLLSKGKEQQHTLLRGWRTTMHTLPLLVVVGLLVLPVLIGGFEHIMLRGNSEDTLIYVTMANGILEYPLEWIRTQPTEILEQISPTLPNAQKYLSARWAVTALLALCAAALGIAPIEFEYVFTLVLFVLFFQGLVSILSATQLLNKATIWLAVAFTVGFWGHFVLDIRAFGHLAAMPIIAVLLAWLIAPLQASSCLFRYGNLITAILVASLIIHYPEITMAFLPAAGLLFLVRTWFAFRNHPDTFHQAGQVPLFFGAVFLFCLPVLPLILHVAFSKAKFASNTSLGWEHAYFSWLQNPIIGLWGGGSILGIHPKIDLLFTAAGWFVGIIFWIALFFQGLLLLKTVRNWQAHFTIYAICTLLLSCLSGYLFLLWKGNPWAGGKMVSYFILLLPVLLAYWSILRPDGLLISNTHQARFHRLLLVAILGWVGMNSIWAGARILHTKRQTEFQTYITHNGAYRTIRAWQIAGIPSFEAPSKSRVAVMDPNHFGLQVRSHLVEGKGYIPVIWPYSRLRDFTPDTTTLSKDVDYVFSNTHYFYAKSVAHLPEHTEFFRPKLNEDFISVVYVEGGYGMELDRTTSRNYVWAAKQAIHLGFVGSTPTFNVLLKLCPGAVRSNTDAITVLLDLDGTRLSEFTLPECTERSIEIPGSTSRFLRDLRITTTDPRSQPTRIGKDGRDLRIKVELVKVGL